MSNKKITPMLKTDLLKHLTNLNSSGDSLEDTGFDLLDAFLVCLLSSCN